MQQKLHSLPAIPVTLLSILWLAIFPLYNDLSYTHITHGKWVGMLVLLGITAAVMVASVLLLIGRRTLCTTLHFTPVQGIALAYFLWVALSALLGSYHDTRNGDGQLAVLNGAIRYEGLYTQLCYAAIFLLMSFYPPRLDVVMNAAGVAMLIFCGVAALQYANYNPFGLFPEGLSVRTNYEFQSTIGNIDMVSGYLSLLVPLLLGGFVLRQRGGRLMFTAGCAGWLMMWCMEVQSGILTLAFAMLPLLCLMLMRSEYRARGMLVMGCGVLTCGIRQLIGFPWLENTETIVFGYAPSGFKMVLLIVGVLLLLGAYCLHRKPGKALRGRTVLILLLVLVLLGVLLLMALPIDERFGGVWEFHETLLGRAQDSFGSYRMGAWRYALDMSRDNLLFGHGPDTFLYALRDHLAALGTSLPENFDNPHNEYVAILSNNGLPALLIYLVLLGTLIVGCFRHGKEEPLLPAVGASLLCFAVQGFFSFSICLVSPMFWCMGGIAAAATASARLAQKCSK